MAMVDPHASAAKGSSARECLAAAGAFRDQGRAWALGVSRQDAVANGDHEKTAVSVEMATTARSKAFGSLSGARWLGLQTAYDLWEARERASQLASDTGSHRRLQLLTCSPAVAQSSAPPLLSTWAFARSIRTAILRTGR